MKDEFIIPVEYNSEILEYQTTLIRLPYSYQLVIDVDKTKLVFEPDDSGKFRMIRLPWQNENELLKVDRFLIEKIIETLNTIYS